MHVSCSEDTLEPLLADLATVWADVMALSDALFTFIQTTMVDAFSTNGSPDSRKLNNTQVTAWFTDLDTVVHHLLLLARQ